MTDATILDRDHRDLDLDLDLDTIDLAIDRLAADSALSNLERTDALARTVQPSGPTARSAQWKFLEAAALISSQTTKIDKLLATRRIAESMVLSTALTNIKRALLEGLVGVKAAFDDLEKGGAS